MKKEIEFTQTLMAKFCHELSGVLGAINNGIELLEEDGPIKDEAASLVSISAKQAISRLIFYRQAYGISKSSGESSLGYFTHIINDFLDGTKSSFTIEEDDAIFSNEVIKIFLSLIVYTNNCLISGGKISVVTKKENDSNKIFITATGEKIKQQEDKENIICGIKEADEFDVHNINAVYVNKLANVSNSKIEISNSNKLEIIITCY